VALPMAVLFGLGGLGLTGISLMQLAFGDTNMVGTNLSEGVAALGAALVVLGWFIRYGRRRA
jgi:hypothetical protein